MLDLSKVWPEWRAIEKVGEGSYGKVYRCVRNEYGIESVCAIKVISIPQNSDGVEDMRFEGLSEAASWAYLSDIVTDFSNEIKVMEMLKNAPNIVSVENYKIIKRTESLGWDIYIRMEFLTGFPDYAVAHKITEEDVLRLGKDICTALSICSKKGIIHRDIKPDNIFIDEYGNFKLGDFGVARKLERTIDSMSRKGTYSYMAPEVYREDHYDGRADIYSLGTVMYKLLNNNRDPFINAHQAVVTVSERSAALSRKRKGEPLPPPAFASAEVANIILKACAFNPDDRYSTVEDFRKDIINALKSGTDFIAPPQKSDKPESKNEPVKVSDKIRIFEIDNVGMDKKEISDLQKSGIVHIPATNAKNTSEEVNPFKNAGESTLVLKNITNTNGTDEPPAPKFIRPMDRELEFPLKKALTPTPPPAQQKADVRPAYVPVEQFKPPIQPKQPVPPVPTRQMPPAQQIKPMPPAPPVFPDIPAQPKPPKKKKIKAGTIVAIIAVVVVIVAAVVAAAYFIPPLLQDMKDSESNVSKDVEYTKTVEEENGYKIELYNSEDILFEEEMYNEENELTGSIEYIFDDEGNETGYKRYDKSGKLIETIDY